jgi:hypothetical protein
MGTGAMFQNINGLATDGQFLYHGRFNIVR